MALYDYKCEEHGYFEQNNRMADHAKGVCPTCGSASKQVLLTAPRPLIEAMADAGCPGAFHTSGDRLEKQHREGGQYHTATKAQQAELNAADADFRQRCSVTST
jgi:putative FmdB family regulatory protein